MTSGAKPHLPTEGPARAPSRPVHGAVVRKPTGHRKHGK